MSGQRLTPSSEGRRIVICDYNALLLSVTGLLRMSDYCVFQAHDGRAAEELCVRMPEISLLVLNTYGTGIGVEGLVGGSVSPIRRFRFCISGRAFQTACRRTGPQYPKRSPPISFSARSVPSLSVVRPRDP